MRKKPLITAASVTYRGGSAFSVVTLEVDPRDMGDMARALDVAEGLDLADHLELGANLRANDEAEELAAAAARGPQSEEPAGDEPTGNATVDRA